MDERKTTAELREADLDQVVGGTATAGAGVDAPVDTTTDATSSIMKTKHDTVKNSISNVR
jgi:hypothetical protein